MKELFYKYEKTVITLLILLIILLSVSLIGIWWGFLKANKTSQPGDFLKVEMPTTPAAPQK